MAFTCIALGTCNSPYPAPPGAATVGNTVQYMQLKEVVEGTHNSTLRFFFNHDSESHTSPTLLLAPPHDILK